MKKVLVLILLLITLYVVIPAYGETILFRNVPWGANISRFYKSFESKPSFIESDDEYLPRWSNREGETNPDVINLNNLYSDGYSDGWVIFSYSVDRDKGLKVSGYPATVTAYFVYGIDEKGNVLRSGDDSRFYMAEYSFDVVDGNIVFDDLKGKLTTLYGLGNEKIGSGREYILDNSGSGDWKNTTTYKYIIKGDNNTVCMLEKVTAAGKCVSLHLVYADENSDTILNETLQAVKNEIQKNEITQSTGNYDGL